VELGDPTVTTALAVVLTLFVLVCAVPLVALRRSWSQNILG